MGETEHASASASTVQRASSAQTPRLVKEELASLTIVLHCSWNWGYCISFATAACSVLTPLAGTFWQML